MQEMRHNRMKYFLKWKYFFFVKGNKRNFSDTIIYLHNAYNVTRFQVDQIMPHVYFEIY